MKDKSAPGGIWRRINDEFSLPLKILVPLTLLLGFAGLYQLYHVKTPWAVLHYLDATRLNRALDLFNSALTAFGGFFIFEPTNNDITRVPLTANIAKILALVIVILLGRKAVLRLFLEDFLLNRFRDHAIVIGLGERGLGKISELRAQKIRVVAIDSDENCPLARAARRLGAVVLTGDATSREMLVKARIAHASQVHIFLPDDNLALDAAAECRRATAARPRLIIYPWTERAGTKGYIYSPDDVFLCDDAGAIASPAVVVCGLDERGSLQVRKLLDAGRKRIVAVGEKPACGEAGVRALRAAGVLLLRGDPHRRETLDRAGVAGAGEVHIFADNDNYAASIALQCHDLFAAATRPPAPPRRLRCLVHVHSARSRAILMENTVLSEARKVDADGFLPQIIADNYRAARELLLEFAPAMLAPSLRRERPPRLLIVGAGTLGHNLLLQLSPLLLPGKGLAPGEGRPVEVTVIDRDPAAEQRFNAAFPFVGGHQPRAESRYAFLKPKFIACDIDQLGAAVVAEIAGDGGFDGVFFCVSNEMTAILAAGALARNLVTGAPIVICTDGNSGLDKLAGGASADPRSPAPLLKNIYIKNVRQAALDDIASSDAASIEKIARALHERWNLAYNKNEPWDRTMLANQHSSLEQATNVFLTLKCLGMQFAKTPPAPPLSPEEAAAASVKNQTLPAAEFPVEWLKVLAQMEHRRWMIYHYVKGWEYAPKRDNIRRLHPDLRPWPKLGAIEREKDLEPLHLALTLLAQNGYAITGAKGEEGNGTAGAGEKEKPAGTGGAAALVAGLLLLLAGMLTGGGTTALHAQDEKTAQTARPPVRLALPDNAAGADAFRESAIYDLARDPDGGEARARKILADGTAGGAGTTAAGGAAGAPLSPAFWAADALAAAGALRPKEDAGALLNLVRSPSDAEAAAALALPPVPRIANAPLAPALRAALARPAVFPAAALAAAGSGVAGEFAPALRAAALDTKAPATRRRAAVLALITGAAAGAPTAGLGSAPENVASTLLTLAPDLAAAATRALLWNGRAVPEELSRRLLALPDALLAAAAGEFAAFPDRLDSAFLRAAATVPNRPATNRAAAALLASRHCVKNSATLDTLATVLTSRDNALVATVLDTFASDSEFARISGAGGGSPDTSDNDRFAAIGNAPSSIVGLDAMDFRRSRRRVGSHIPEQQWPDTQSIMRFFTALERVALGKNFGMELRNNAYALLLRESGLAQMADILHKFLANPSPETARLATRIALEARHEPRLLEIVLLAAAANPAALDFSQLDALAPFLVRDNARRTRLLAGAGRRLAAAPDAARRTLGLLLIGAHGSADDGALLRANLNAADVRVRRAAFFALARHAPEVFALRAAVPAAADPDARVRATVPLAFALAGFRWELEIAPGIAVEQWARPSAGTTLDAASEQLVRQLTGDTDPLTRRLALRTLLQHGRLDDAGAGALLALCPPGEASVFTAELAQSVAAALSGGRAVPEKLRRFAPPPRPKDAPVAAPPALAVFVAPGSLQQLRLDATVAALRDLLPGVRVEFYFSDAAANGALALLRRRFPITHSETRAPVLVVAPGVWTAGARAPSFAALAGMAAFASATGAEPLEKILNLKPLPVAAWQSLLAEDVVTAMENIADISTKEAEAQREERESLQLPEGSVFWFFVVVFGVLCALGIAIILLKPWYERLPDRRRETAAGATGGAAKPQKDDSE
jgi:voltage-gated potassium channel Kch